MEDKRYAVLIDAENVSHKYISYILDEMTKYGVITYKRAYGDWTSVHVVKWKNELLEYSIVPIQQFSNTIGKNASDSALIIDAMDILYTGNVDGFCIVSSDSDFTRLASRLRESGMDVIGMGESKTPRAFKAACTIFTNLDLIAGGDMGEQAEERDTEAESETGTEVYRNRFADDEDEVLDIATIEKDITAIISENENKGKDTYLGEIGNRLIKKYPDFDVRNYGYASLNKFLEEEIFCVDLIRDDKRVVVRLKPLPKQELLDFITATVASGGRKGIELGLLGQKIHEAFENFQVSDYGYTKFEKFIEGSTNCMIIKDGHGGKSVKNGKV